MITLGIPGIIASYILIAIFLLYLNLYSNWAWQYKVGGIIVTSFFYLVLYFSFPPVLGSPTGENPPPDFRIIGTHVQKPGEPDGKDGMIYLWLARVDASLEIIEPPRAYKLPYTLGFHEKIIGVQEVRGVLRENMIKECQEEGFEKFALRAMQQQNPDG